MTNDRGDTVACDCPQCRELCSIHPGWFTPEEAMRAMDAGHAMSMMLDLRYAAKERPNNVQILCPGVIDHRGARRGGCIAVQLWERVPLEDQIEPSKNDTFSLALSGLAIIKAHLEGKMRTGTCLFLKDGLCSIHETDFKPVECRTGYGCGKGQSVDRKDIADMWDTDLGRQAIARWRDETGCTQPYEEVLDGLKD